MDEASLMLQTSVSRDIILPSSPIRQDRPAKTTRRRPNPPKRTEPPKDFLEPEEWKEIEVERKRFGIHLAGPSPSVGPWSYNPSRVLKHKEFSKNPHRVWLA
jgi:hypothetical protein